MAKFTYGDLREHALARYCILVDPDSEQLLGVDGMGLQTEERPWHYIGGTTVTLDGTNPAEVTTIPADATIFQIRARGGEVHFEINGVTASALSPGYLPEDQGEVQGPFDNLVGLWLYSATAATVAHLMWYRVA